MAIVTQFLTGFEYGVASGNGSGLFGTVDTSVVTIGATTPRNGVYRARIAALANARAIGQKNLGSGTKYVARIGIQFATRPTAGSTEVYYFVTGAGPRPALFVDLNGQLSVSCGGTTVTGPTVDTASYHLIELQADVSTLNAWTVDWKVDGVAQTQATNGAVAASTITATGIGSPSTTQGAFTCNYDDWIVGTWTVAATDWYGDGKVIAQQPGSDGTHSTPADFSPGDAGTQYTGTVTTAWTQVHPLPMTTARSSTVNLAQRVAAAAYMEVAPAPTSEAGTANAVMAYMSYSSSTTAANTATAVVRSSAGVDISLLGTVATPAAWNVTVNNFKSALVTKPAAGWTATEVNAIRWRFGWSNDIAPVPTAQAFMIEVDWPVVGGGALTGTAADSVTQSDAVVTATAFARTAADAPTQSDAATSAASFARTASDTVTRSDVATGTKGTSRTASDTVTRSDVAVRALQAFGRTVADTSTQSDTAAGTRGTSRAASDGVTRSDAVSRVAAFARTASDTSTQSDATSRVASFARTAADTVTRSDIASGQAGRTRTASDTSTQSDTLARSAQPFARTAADSVARSDVATEVRGLPRVASDTVTRSDVATGRAGTTKTATDAVTQSDVGLRSLLHFTRTAGDALTRSDLATPVAVFGRTVFDTSTLSDVVTGKLGTTKTASDTSGQGDVATGRVALGGSAFDSVTVADSAIGTTGRPLIQWVRDRAVLKLTLGSATLQHIATSATARQRLAVSSRRMT